MTRVKLTVMFVRCLSLFDTIEVHKEVKMWILKKKKKMWILDFQQVMMYVGS